MLVPSDQSATGLSRKDDFRNQFVVFSAVVNHELAIKCLAWPDFDDTFRYFMILLPPFLEKSNSVNALYIKEISPYFGLRMIL